MVIQPGYDLKRDPGSTARKLLGYAGKVRLPLTIEVASGKSSSL